MAKTQRILCWNINGIRAAWKKGFPEWALKENADIICLQETKAQPDQLENDIINLGDYTSYFFSAEKKGYSGVAIYTKHKPLSVRKGLGIPLYDVEGRVIEMEFEKFVLYAVYFPNGGRGPERVQYKLDFYDALFQRCEMMRLKNKNIIVCGDYNTAHKEIDLARPKENQKTTGFLPHERAWIDKIIDMGYTDAFRTFNQEAGQYTYWDQITRARDRNVGWRIDYFMVSNEAMPLVKNACLHMQTLGSDHCPIELAIEV
ncbi:MAG: exodeoxyribonuclease III [Bacteroidia bacterium]|nr:exodeoxyribonuclease III [Bacteroidia bacterium]